MIKVDTTRCQASLYSKAECRLCADVCPVENCLTMSGRSPAVDNDRCLGCGICTTVCPTSAFLMETLDDRELLKRLQTEVNNADFTRSECPGQHMLLSCYLSGHSTPIADNHKESRHAGSLSPESGYHLNIKLPCLAILKESHLVLLMLQGVRIDLDVSECSACSFSHGKETIETNVAYSNALLTACGRKDSVILRYDAVGDISSSSSENMYALSAFGKRRKHRVKMISPVQELSRRELFSILRQKVSERLTDEVTPMDEKGGERKEATIERRHILLDMLKGLNIPASAVLTDGTFPVRKISVSRACNLCGDCQIFCPAGAIKKVESEQSVGIDFQLSRCMNCYQCEELCPEKAMRRESAINMEPFFSDESITLFSKRIENCPSCNNKFFPEDGREECSSCSKRKRFDDKVFGIYNNNQINYQ